MNQPGNDVMHIINGKTAINFNEHKVTGPCNMCGAIGETNSEHFGRFVKTAFKSRHFVKCGGKFGRGLKKRQGSRVKKYRKILKQSGIKFTESMFVNSCQCDYGFDFVCEPGQMVVVFTWE